MSLSRAMHSIALALNERRVELAGALLAAGLFGFGMTFEGGITLKALMFGVFGLMATTVLMLPYAWAIRLLFVYLGFEGMAKILTGYNPVVHVGSDALIMGLSMRWCLSVLLMRARAPRRLPPLTPLLGLHFAWYLIEFCNPHSIGLIPSIAAAKMYVTVMILFFFGYYLSASLAEVEKFTWIWVGTLMIQIATSLYQGYLGPASVIAISPGYAEQLAKYGNYAFRPFGTTNLPGSPALFIYLGAPLLCYQLLRTRSHLLRVFLMAWLPPMIVTLGLCQIRSALLKTIVGVTVFVFVVLARSSGEVRRKALIALPIVAALLAFGIPRLAGQYTESREENSAAFERSLSLFDYNSVSGARSGAADRILSYAREIPLGAGLSRTGAAAGKFYADIAADPIYKTPFFTDNFWAATLAEVGIPGTLFITSLIAGVLLLGMRGIYRTPDPRSCALQGAILGALFAQVIGLWGAEGLLYNPEAPFFWFFAGSLLRLPELPESRG